MLIYDALKYDHENIRSLLSELVMLEESDDCESLIEQIHDELIPHARAEVAIFYNSLREVESVKDAVKHSFKEHIEAEALLKTLQLKSKIDADWKKTARKLKNAIEGHIQDEEDRIFNVAKQVFTTKEAAQLAEAFERMKPEVQEEGFIGTTFDLIKNLMPPRFTKSLRDEMVRDR